MKFLITLSLILGSLFSVKAIHFFNGTYEQALQQAKAQNKNLFIEFTTNWCGPCRLMKKIVFDNEKVTRYTDQHYICLQLDIEFPENELLQQRVSSERAGGVPHICILTPDEKVIKEASTLTVHQMMKFLKLTPRDKPIRNLLALENVIPHGEKPRLFQYRTSYTTLLNQARQENKNMLLCFSSHFCGPCRQMENTTFQNPAIMEKVNNQFVTGYFEVGDPKDRALCYRYHNTVVGIPFLVLATPDEKIIRKNIGYLDSAAFMTFIRPSTESPQEQINPQQIQFSDGKVSGFSRFYYNNSNRKWQLQVIAALNTTTLKTSGTLSEVDFNYRVGYALGFSFAREGKHFAFAPGLSFVSKGGRNEDFTLRQNYLELPVKCTWIYWNNDHGWWKGLSVSPYGALRIGQKLKSHGNNLSREAFKTKRLDYGLKCATNLRYSSFDFEFGYLLGLANISDYQGGKMYNRGFFLNISLCF